MNKYMIINGVGVGKITKQKITESAEFYGVKFNFIGGERSAYGNPEYSIISTDEPFDSEFIQSIAFNTKVSKL